MSVFSWANDADLRVLKNGNYKLSQNAESTGYFDPISIVWCILDTGLKASFCHEKMEGNIWKEEKANHLPVYIA